MTARFKIYLAIAATSLCQYSFGQETKRVSIDISAGLATNYWTQDYTLLVTYYNPISGTRQTSDDNKYSALSPAFLATIRVPIRLKNISIGPTYRLTAIMTDILKGDKYQYSSFGAYKLESRMIHTAGVMLEVHKLKIRGKEYIPVLDLGLSLHKGEEQYEQDNNYFTSLALRFELTNKSYLAPSITYIHSRWIYEGPFTTGGLDGSSDWAISIRKNSIFQLGLSYGIVF